jgi:hypothetical protein
MNTLCWRILKQVPEDWVEDEMRPYGQNFELRKKKLGFRKYPPMRLQDGRTRCKKTYQGTKAVGKVLSTLLFSKYRDTGYEWRYSSSIYLVVLKKTTY